MKGIFDYFINEWDKLLDAPLLFSLACLIGYYLARWRYKRVIDILTVKNSQYVEGVNELNNEKKIENSAIQIFEAPSDGKYNYPFYEYFIDRIKNAKDIYITGDGFECTNEEGENIAKNFIKSFRDALDGGATIVRVETKSQGPLKWAQMLAELSKEYGDQFSLYVLKEKKSTQMASVCVIDADISKSSMVEMMLSTQRLFGVKAADLAGTAVFLSGQDTLAQDLRRRILTLQKPEFSVHLLTPSEIINTLAGEAYYFAFGSNMDSKQMKQRCASAKYVGTGVLKNHEIVFNRKGTYRAGGVASVENKTGKDVYGVIWRINPIEFDQLDKTEDPKAYRRFSEEIYTLDGKAHNCNVYKAIPSGSFEPDEEYLILMLEAAKSNDLPDSYIEYLEHFKVKT